MKNEDEISRDICNTPYRIIQKLKRTNELQITSEDDAFDQQGVQVSYENIEEIVKRMKAYETLINDLIKDAILPDEDWSKYEEEEE